MSQKEGLLSLTCLPVIALDIDAEHRNPLPLHIVVIEINVWDGDVPGRKVSGGAGGGGCLHGGVILQHHHGFLHLEWKEGGEVKVTYTVSNFIRNMSAIIRLKTTSTIKNQGCVYQTHLLNSFDIQCTPIIFTLKGSKS